jgi:hypothetical protein
MRYYLTGEEIRGIIIDLLHQDWFMRHIYNEYDFIRAVIEELESIAEQENALLDEQEAIMIADSVWNEKGKAIVEKKLDNTW